MDNNISRITNAFIKVTDYKINEDGKKEEKNAQQKGKEAEENNKQLNPSDVLGIMAAQNADKKINIEKVSEKNNVTNESKARIEESVKSFEEIYNRALAIAMEEFPDLSEEAASQVALAYIDAAY